MPITEVFTYAERVENAAQSFLKLKDEYLEWFGSITFRNRIATEWVVNPTDLDEKVWEITQQTRSA